MGLNALLAEVDPGWFEPVGSAGRDHATGEQPLPRELVTRARGSQLGRRMLAGWLVASGAPALFEPRPGTGATEVVARWDRSRLVAMIRDAGVLAFAPAIRAQVDRTAVRRLRNALGNSYLLALDRSVWDGVVDATRVATLSSALREALAADDDVALFWLLERQGRAELRSWAMRRDPLLADWIALMHPREAMVDAHLPEKPLLRVYTHHESRLQA